MLLAVMMIFYFILFFIHGLVVEVHWLVHGHTNKIKAASFCLASGLFMGLTGSTVEAVSLSSAIQVVDQLVCGTME